MLGLRLRLAPGWLRAQPRCRPLHAGVLAVLAPVLAGVLLALLVPARSCSWRPATGATRPHLICVTVRQQPQQPRPAKTLTRVRN